MFMVFWTENSVPCGKKFDSKEMTEALKFSESLRKRKLQGEDILFVVLSSENPDCVGQQGVDVASADYNWKKRRI